MDTSGSAASGGADTVVSGAGSGNSDDSGDSSSACASASLRRSDATDAMSDAKKALIAQVILRAYPAILSMIDSGVLLESDPTLDRLKELLAPQVAKHTAVAATGVSGAECAAWLVHALKERARERQKLVGSIDVRCKHSVAGSAKQRRQLVPRIVSRTQ